MKNALLLLLCLSAHFSYSQIKVQSSEDCSSFGICDGQATILAEGNHSPFTYKWPDGQETFFRDDLCGGEHHVTVTNNKGCDKVLVVDIADCTLPDNVMSIQLPTCESGGSIDLNGLGSDYNVLWDDGSVLKSRKDLNPAFYDLKITQVSTGCELKKSIRLYNSCQKSVSGPIQVRTSGKNEWFNVEKVFPNPLSSKDHLFVKLFSKEVQDVDLVIYDKSQQQASKMHFTLQPGQNMKRLPMGELTASGLYTVMLVPANQLRAWTSFRIAIMNE